MIQQFDCNSIVHLLDLFSHLLIFIVEMQLYGPY